MFFLLILNVLFNLILDVIYKRDRFSKILLKKDFELISIREINLILFHINLILLLVKVNLFSKKKNCKKGILMAFFIKYIEIVFIITNKIIIFYMQILII